MHTPWRSLVTIQSPLPFWNSRERTVRAYVACATRCMRFLYLARNCTQLGEPSERAQKLIIHLYRESEDLLQEDDNG